MYRIFNADVLDALKNKIEDKSIDCVITSPPYWVKSFYKVIPTTWNDGWIGCLGQEPTFSEYSDHILEIFQVLKSKMKSKNSFVWFFNSDFDGMLSKLSQCGWNKVLSFQIISSVDNQNGRDMCYCFSQSGIPLPFMPNIREDMMMIRYKTYNFYTFSPELLSALINVSTYVGDTILDLFAGTGGVGISAEKNDRNSVLVEIDPEVCKMAEERIFEETRESSSG